MSLTHYAKIPSIRRIEEYLIQNDIVPAKAYRQSVQKILWELRKNTKILEAQETDQNSILELIRQRLRTENLEMQPLINATGTIVHTNLGRSIISDAIWQEAGKKIKNYINLEYSLQEGERGNRDDNIEQLLQVLTGTESAVLLNNNAAAVFLIIAAIAEKGEVLISRGELIEIGGSFRLPEIIGQAGAKIKEVGTTNRTYIDDFEKNITAETKLIIKARHSNYTMSGFVHETEIKELAQLGARYSIPVMEDSGSGLLQNLPFLNQNPKNRTTKSILRDGADIVSISGDKMLGGPQAGIILGKKEFLQLIKKHPLYRTMRCGKVILSLLESTLLSYIRGNESENIPTISMIRASENDVKQRAKHLQDLLKNDLFFSLEPCFSTPGGGSFPGVNIPSWGVRVLLDQEHLPLFSKKLRKLSPPIITRITQGKLILDCRTILGSQLTQTAKILHEGILEFSP